MNPIKWFKIPEWMLCQHRHRCWCKKGYGWVIGLILGLVSVWVF